VLSEFMGEGSARGWLWRIGPGEGREDVGASSGYDKPSRLSGLCALAKRRVRGAGRYVLGLLASACPLPFVSMSIESSFSAGPEPTRVPASSTPPPAGESTTPPVPVGEAAPGTPGAGEDFCPVCGGSGKDVSGSCRANCDGTGRVIVGIGGA
jgi:hypothetical protein